MTKASDILTMLLPEGGWATHGDNFEDITFIEAEPLTKEQFTAGAAKYETWKAEQDAAAEAAKKAAQAKLADLGLTTDDLKALGLGGN